jgi:hypothetical protein
MSEEENVDSNVQNSKNVMQTDYGSPPNKFKRKECGNEANEFDSRPLRTIVIAPSDFSSARSAGAIIRWVRDIIIGDIIDMVSQTVVLKSFRFLT